MRGEHLPDTLLYLLALRKSKQQHRQHFIYLCLIFFMHVRYVYYYSIKKIDYDYCKKKLISMPRNGSVQSLDVS